MSELLSELKLLMKDYLIDIKITYYICLSKYSKDIAKKKKYEEAIFHCLNQIKFIN